MKYFRTKIYLIRLGEWEIKTGGKAMFTLRCTKKLLDYFNAEPVNDSLLATTLLGDWYVTLFPSVAGEHLLFLNGSLLLNITAHATKDVSALCVFYDKIDVLFKLLDIPNNMRENEFKEMGSISLGAARSNSISSFMGHFTWRYQRTIDKSGQRISDDLTDLEVGMNHLPIKKFGFSNPFEITRDLFKKSSMEKDMSDNKKATGVCV